MDGPRLNLNNGGPNTTAEPHSPPTEADQISGLPDPDPLPGLPDPDPLPGGSRMSKPWTPPANFSAKPAIVLASRPVPSAVVLGSKPTLLPISLASASMPSDEHKAKRARLEDAENIPPENEVVMFEANVSVVHQQQQQPLIRPSAPPGNSKALRIMKLIENQQIIEAKKLQQSSEAAGLVSKLMDNLQYLGDGN